MSEITNVKSSLKKISMLIEEITNQKAESYSKLSAQPQHLLELLEKLEGEKNNYLDTINSNTDEISSFKNKISQNQRDITKLEEEKEELTKERQELTARIQTTQNELTDIEKEVKTKKAELESRSQQLRELEKKIDELTFEHERFDEELKKLEIELESKYVKRENFVKSYEHKVSAMNLLIKKGYIKSVEYNLISSLQKDTTLELKSILIAKDIQDDVAKRILRKIVDQGGPIEYDEGAGTVTLKGEVDF